MGGIVFGVERRERRKEIPGYGGRYEVGDLGHVYTGGCEMALLEGRYVHLSKEGHVERISVAYLVARAFIRNLEGRPYVVHLDGNPRNNRVENLQWSEVKGRRMGHAARKVLQYDLDGNLVGKYRSVKEASECTGVARSLITRCALGKARRAKQFVFRYE